MFRTAVFYNDIHSNLTTWLAATESGREAEYVGPAVFV